MTFSVKPVLKSRRTVLRPFTEADAEVMWEIVEDPEVLDRERAALNSTAR